MKAWNWFLAHGEKALSLATAALGGMMASGQVSPTEGWAIATLATLNFVHNTFLPPPKPKEENVTLQTPKQKGAGRPEMLLLLAIFALVACKSLGLATPQSFDEQLANAYGIHTAVVSATATALQSGAISRQEAEQVQTQEASARAFLDAARAAETSGNIRGATTDLQLATGALVALQTYLNSR